MARKKKKRLPECPICSLPLETEVEKSNAELYGCARIERKTVEYALKVRTCIQDPTTGRYIPPSELPEPVEDPDAFKELFCRKYNMTKKDGNK